MRQPTQAGARIDAHTSKLRAEVSALLERDRLHGARWWVRAWRWCFDSFAAG